MKAQQASPFCCRFANNRIFPNSPESVSTLWRYDWCKKHMSLCRGRQQHGRLRDTLMRSQWLSRWILQREPAQPEMPHSREDFVVHSCIEVCFFPVETVTPTLTSDGAQKKTLAFCCCALRCIWDSNELVCSKMEKRRFEIARNATSAKSCSRRNLKMWPNCYGRMKLDMTRTQTTW